MVAIIQSETMSGIIADIMSTMLLSELSLSRIADSTIYNIVLGMAKISMR